MNCDNMADWNWKDLWKTVAGPVASAFSGLGGLVCFLTALMAWHQFRTIAFWVVMLGSCVVSIITACWVLRAQRKYKIYVGDKGGPAPRFNKTTKWICGTVAVVLVIFTGVAAYQAVLGRPSEQSVDSSAPATSVSGASEEQDSVTSQGDYPSVDEIRDLPLPEKVLQPPDVPAADVNFRYKNSSGVDLKLILFNCYYHYKPIDDPLAPKSAWRIWDFTATDKYFTFSEFERGTGWYVFFVKRCDTGRYYQLATTNIFYSEWPTLVVTSTDNEDEPFSATFGREQ